VHDVQPLQQQYDAITTAIRFCSLSLYDQQFVQVLLELLLAANTCSFGADMHCLCNGSCVQIGVAQYDAIRSDLSSTTAKVNTLTVTVAALRKQLESEAAQHEVQCTELVLQRDTAAAEAQSSMQTITTLQVIACYSGACKRNTLQQYTLLRI
jgi:hypothetical protein